MMTMKTMRKEKKRTNKGALLQFISKKEKKKKVIGGEEQQGEKEDLDIWPRLKKKKERKNKDFTTAKIKKKMFISGNPTDPSCVGPTLEHFIGCYNFFLTLP